VLDAPVTQVEKPAEQVADPEGAVLLRTQLFRLTDHANPWGREPEAAEQELRIPLPPEVVSTK